MIYDIQQRMMYEIIEALRGRAIETDSERFRAHRDRQWQYINGAEMNRYVLPFLTGALLAGCSNPGIIQVSPDTYLLAREAHGGIFASSTALKAGVIQDANAFAESQGKVAIPISAKEKPMGNGPAQWASFEYQFRVVEKDDPAVRRTQMVHNPNVVIQKADPDEVSPRQGDKSGTKDLYSELLKLEDLKKRGLLNDAEFEAQKKKLLQ